MFYNWLNMSWAQHVNVFSNKALGWLGHYLEVSSAEHLKKDLTVLTLIQPVCLIDFFEKKQYINQKGSCPKIITWEILGLAKNM